MGIILSVCQQSRFGWQQTDGLQAFDARPLADNTVEGLFSIFSCALCHTRGTAGNRHDNPFHRRYRDEQEAGSYP